jgi:hypothetical protein
MSHDDIEPLEPGIWLLQLQKVATICPAEEAALAMGLRRAFHLVQLAPRPLRHLITCALSEQAFEELLEAGALLPAAVALVGDRLNYSLTQKSLEGRAEAEVWFPNDAAYSHATGSSAPFALFAAWLECLLTLDRPEDPNQERIKSPIRRKSQSARRPKLTEH